MHGGQHFVDLQENSNFGDPNSWLSGEDYSSFSERGSQSLLANSSTAAGTNGNLDRVLFNDLVEMVPLVQSLIVISLSLFSILIFSGFPLPKLA